MPKSTGEKFTNVRQRLQQWYKEKRQAYGRKYAELDVASCFAPLLKWVLELLGESDDLFLALDATHIGQKFIVLSLNVLYRGSGIPVAWKIVKASQKHPWKPLWQDLLRRLSGVVPESVRVWVLADRGLYACWLYEEIVALGWHPLLRINSQGYYQVRSGETLADWQPLEQVVRVGESFSQPVRCFRQNPLDCTLLARWDEDYKDPWLLLSDASPQSASAAFYGFRSWTEAAYRDLKSDGFNWQRTRLTHPHRAECLWLAMSVALLWLITEGACREDSQKPSTSPRTDSDSTGLAAATLRPRTLSCWRLGCISFVVRLFQGLPLSWGRHRTSPYPGASLAFDTS
ncbi:transposase [Baaleninema simplex]|uniref:transposase n=1 Tax=Baaleninema simplex TaxID=2862350 RepID=UPI0003459381|nr:transposase [Baaleninema simplex]